MEVTRLMTGRGCAKEALIDQTPQGRWSWFSDPVPARSARTEAAPGISDFNVTAIGPHRILKWSTRRSSTLPASYLFAKPEIEPETEIDNL